MPDLDPVPGTLDHTNVQVSENAKPGRAQVEIARVAGHATVNNGHVNRLAVVVGADLAAAQRVVVGIAVGGVGVEIGTCDLDRLMSVVDFTVEQLGAAREQRRCLGSDGEFVKAEDRQALAGG